MRIPETTIQAVVDLGRLSLDFGRINRITCHPDGLTPESDTDHTVALGLIACAIAAEFYPDMNLGLVAQYALVHDLPEVYAGDTPTLRMPTADAKAGKAQRERDAIHRIDREFAAALPWLPDMITYYEARSDREARFVKAVDKVIPKVTHLLNGGVTVRGQGMSVADVAARYEAQVDEMASYAGDFPELMELRRMLVDRLIAQLTDLATSVTDEMVAVFDGTGNWADEDEARNAIATVLAIAERDRLAAVDQEWEALQQCLSDSPTDGVAPVLHCERETGHEGPHGAMRYLTSWCDLDQDGTTAGSYAGGGEVR